MLEIKENHIKISQCNANVLNYDFLISL